MLMDLEAISAPVLEIMQRGRVLRAKDERIAVLETENATLHIQVAQELDVHALETLGLLEAKNEDLQNSFKALLQRKKVAATSNRCNHCDASNKKILILHQQVQGLKGNLSDLRSQCAMYEQQLHNKIKTLSTIIPAIIQKHFCRSAEFNALQSKYQQERKKRKELHNTLVELRGNIRVHCRLRPVLQVDIDKGNTGCMKCIDDETVQVNHTQASFLGSSVTEKMFNFDRVHGPIDSQQVVFSEVRPLMTSLLDGYNVCIMAYGQTGSGKTYTMLGAPVGSEKTPGVIPLAAIELFRLIGERDVNFEVAVTVAEIYNEQIRDLLSQGKGNVNHDVVSGHNGDIGVTNLTVRSVTSPDELISLVRDGMKHRATHSTNIHEHSSRSHLIVTVQVTGTCGEGGLISAANSISSLQLNATITPVSSTETTPMVSPISSPPRGRYNKSHLSSSIHISSSAPNLVPTASSTSSLFSTVSGGSSRNTSPRYQRFHVKLQLVDLAGSECVGQSGVGGNNLREAQHINRSLCSLSDVLGALAEKRAHIPYRNSVLTHLLQDSIGGNAKMLMFLCLSPTTQYVGESLRVLGFGTRARQVQRPVPVKRTQTDKI